MQARGSLITLALSGALVLAMAGLAPAVAADDQDDPTSSTAPTTTSPTTTAPDHLSSTQKAPASQTVLRRQAAKGKRAWPTKKVVGATVKYMADSPVAAPAQVLKSARVVQDVVNSTFSADITLKASPTASTDSWVRVGFGKARSDGHCYTIVGDGGSNVYWTAYGTDVLNLDREGAHMRLINFPSAAAGKDQFDCAFVETYEVLPDDAPEDEVAEVYSGRGDYSLARTFDKPKLELTAPKRVNVKVGTWKTVKVRVRNASSRVTAPGVKVTVKGKKVTARAAKLGKLRPGKSKTAKVRIKVARGFKAKAKIRVVTKTLTKSRKLRLT